MKRLCLMSLIVFGLILAGCGGSSTPDAGDDAVSAAPSDESNTNDNGGDDDTGGDVEVGLPTVAAGLLHSCAVDAGKVLCWGSNESGQLGNGTTTDSAQPVEVQGIDDATAVAAASEATCAVHRGGAVSCWGASAREAYGAGKGDSPTPVAVAGITNAVDISISSKHGCATTTAATVLCWGAQSRGVLGGGDPATANAGGAAAAPVQAAGVSGAVGVAVGNLTSCAVLGSGTVMCWGNNEYDNLGTGSTERFSPTPQPVLGLDDAVEMSTTGSYSCAVVSDGTLTCWGERRSNLFETIPGGGDVTTPTAIPGIDDAVVVATSDAHICIIGRGGDVSCWGNGQYGQLGNGDTSPVAKSDTPVQVKGISDAVSVATGNQHTCAITESGTVSCWGFNTSGQVGGTESSVKEATPVAGLG